jgi:hypothetical protein
MLYIRFHIALPTQETEIFFKINEIIFALLDYQEQNSYKLETITF